MAESGYIVLAFRYPVLPSAYPAWESSPYARLETIKQRARSHYLAHSARYHYEIQSVEVGKEDGVVRVLSRRPLLQATPRPGTRRIRWVSCENQGTQGTPAALSRGGAGHRQCGNRGQAAMERRQESGKA
ncbi:hypothetical protein [Thioalkalivibrio sp. ALE19]|uniref:hypothetical protein n=1 Tax=Thioalkalivibrio sp. ALE19 TaxID=1266909 RepID=UPI001E52566D|nr:hypothetical protein [Thioalkalivibrio sp. ALE19]